MPREDEAPLRRLNELLADWYWEQDEQLRLTYLSSRLGENPGFDLSAYLGRNRWDQPALNLTQAEWDRHRAQLERREAFRDFEIECLADDGRAVWLSLSAEPVFDEAGRFQGYRGIGLDVTLRKRAEQLLALEHAVTRCLAQAATASEGVTAALRAICGAEGWDSAQLWKLDEAAGVLRRAEHWTAAGVDRTGDGVSKPGVGLVGSVWQSQEPLWIADSMQDPLTEYKELAEGTGLRAVLLFPVRYGGRIIGVLDLSCRAIRAPEQGVLDALDVIGNQLGQFLQRALAEQAVRHSESRFRSLTNLSSHWYWELDASYRFTRLEGRNVAGGDKELQRRLMGLRRWESGLEVENGWDAHRALLDARKPFYDVLMWRRSADGTVRYISVSGEPVFGPDGSFAGYHGVGRDVSGQKRGEQMLRLEHEVASALAAAEDTASGLKAVIRAVCEAEGWDSGRYYRVDDSGGALRFQDGWCVNAQGIDQFLERMRGAWQSGKPAWSGSAPQDSRPRLTEAGGEDAFAFPIISEGRTIGVIAFSGRSVRPPDPRLQQAARMIGSQVGQFLLRKQAEDSLRESEERFRNLTQMSSDFFWESDAQHRITKIVHGPNYAAEEIEENVIGNAPWDIPAVSPDEAGWAAHKATLDSHVAFRDFEFARARADGAIRHFSISGEPKLGPDGAFLGYRGVGRDITEIALTRERIALLAYKDPLTGLANRTSLGPALEQAVERARRHGSKFAGVFIDLDGFKQINDLYGHDAGDRFLVEVARRIRANLRSSDLVARLGGDEFFVVLEDVRDSVPVELVARKLLDGLLHPYVFEGATQARVSASIGVSVFPDDAEDAATLIKHADKAMYLAKQAGKSGYCFFPAANNGKAPDQAGNGLH